jgi:predicted site-specific integrase-resolvase
MLANSSYSLLGEEKEVGGDDSLRESQAASPRKPSASRQAGFLSLGKASLLLGIHVATLRRLCDDGSIACHVMPSGHRRISQSAIREYLGEDPEGTDPNGSEKIAIYARVSDSSQNCKGKDGQSSLEHQLERLLTEVSKLEGIGRDEIAVYRDVASSFGDREGLNRLVDSIVSNTIKKVYCLYLDRLSRVPCLTRLIEFLARKFGTEIIALDTEDCEGQDIWQRELLGYLTVWCNRQSAVKASKILTKHVSPEAIEMAVKWRAEGLTVMEIYKKLKRMGHSTTTKLGKVSEISYSKLRKLLDNGSGMLLTKVTMGNDAAVSDTACDFIASRLIKTENVGDRISCGTVYGAYAAFCRQQNKQPLPRANFGKKLTERLGKGSDSIVWSGSRKWRYYRLAQ